MTAFVRSPDRLGAFRDRITVKQGVGSVPVQEFHRAAGISSRPVVAFQNAKKSAAEEFKRIGSNPPEIMKK